MEKKFHFLKSKENDMEDKMLGGRILSDSPVKTAPYASYTHHSNSISVFPKVELKTEIKTEPEYRYPSPTILHNIIPKIEGFNSPSYGCDGNESTVPTALGLFPTSSLKENPAKKPKAITFLNNMTMEQMNTSYITSRKRKNDYGIIYDRVITEKSCKVTPESNKRTGSMVYGFMKYIGPHKWVVSEWFQSFMDTAILNEITDFQYRFDQIIPPMFKNGFSRFEWTYLRTMMGAVRRFSPEFIQAERYEWERIRVIMRLLQTKSTGYVRNIDIMNGIPEQIPRVLPNGSDVQAIIRNPFRGVHNGSIITFEEPVWAYTVRFPAFEEMGDRLIPDFQLMAIRNPGTLTLQSVRAVQELQENYQFKIGDGDCVNGYSSKDLISFLELQRINRSHKEQLMRLSTLHNKIQNFSMKQSLLMKSRSREVEEFRFWLEHNLDTGFLRKYACIMLTIEKLDAVLMRHMEEVEKFRSELHHMLSPVLSECSDEELVERCRVSCHVDMLETYRRPIAGGLWDKICKVLMILKFVQATGINERGLYILKIHLHNIFLATEGESAHIFGNVLIPLLEMLLEEINQLKSLKLAKYPPGVRT